MAEAATKIINGVKIDPVIFTFQFTCRCTGECCNYGVYTDLKEYEKIIDVRENILPLLDESQPKDVSRWFEKPEKDEDFESGLAVGTEIHNDKCTFLDKDGLCTLQKLALIRGEHKWKYKPIYCVLFPLTIYEGALTIDDDHIDRLKTCNKQEVNKISIYEACIEEIKHFFGEEGFKELESYRDEYFNNIKAGEILK